MFEWVTEQLGAQGAVCAGGRYDGLVAQLGGKAIPAAGFALGLERLVELIAAKDGIKNVPDAYLVTVGKKAQQAGLLFAEQLRNVLPNFSLVVNYGGGSFKTQFKRADKSGAKFALILGEEEAAQEVVAVKYLREDKPQKVMSFSQLVKFFK